MFKFLILMQMALAAAIFGLGYAFTVTANPLLIFIGLLTFGCMAQVDSELEADYARMKRWEES